MPIGDRSPMALTGHSFAVDEDILWGASRRRPRARLQGALSHGCPGCMRANAAVGQARWVVQGLRPGLGELVPLPLTGQKVQAAGKTP
jgi:hypothetical protein